MIRVMDELRDSDAGQELFSSVKLGKLQRLQRENDTQEFSIEVTLKGVDV